MKFHFLPELLRDRLPAELERDDGRRIPFLLSAVEGRDLSLPFGLFSICLSSSEGMGVGVTAPTHIEHDNQLYAFNMSTQMEHKC